MLPFPGVAVREDDFTKTPISFSPSPRAGRGLGCRVHPRNMQRNSPTEPNTGSPSPKPQQIGNLLGKPESRTAIISLIQLPKIPLYQSNWPPLQRHRIFALLVLTILLQRVKPWWQIDKRPILNPTPSHQQHNLPADRQTFTEKYAILKTAPAKVR